MEHEQAAKKKLYFHFEPDISVLVASLHLNNEIGE